MMDKKDKSPQAFSKERRQVLLDIATELFLAKGWGRVSIDLISKESRVSKSTIYRHFKNKEALFETVAINIAKEQAAEITAFQLGNQPAEIALRRFAEHVYRVNNTPRNLEFLRIHISEAGHQPQLAASIWNTGRAAVLTPLLNYFEHLISTGAMVHPDPQLAVNTFYMLARGNLRTLLGVNLTPDEELKKINVDIDIFLKGCEIIPPQSQEL